MMFHLRKLLNTDENATATSAPDPTPESVAASLAAPAPKPGASPTPAAPTPDPKIASKFAALAKGERTLTAREKVLAEREAAIVAREKGIADPRGLVKSDPTKAAEMIGLSYEEWTRHMLSQAKPANPAEVKLTALEQKVLDMEKNARERAEADAKLEREAEQLEKLQSVTDFVAQAGEKYEFIERTKYQGVVLDVIEKFAAANDGRLLSFEEACDLTEKYLEDQVEATFAWKKVQAKFGAKKDAPILQPKGTAPVGGTAATKTDSTITSDLSTATRIPARTVVPSQHDEFAAAAKLLKFSKKA